MTEYSINLDGIAVGDELQCTNGDRILITMIFYKYYAYGFTLNRKYGKILINHSEKDNICWKFYKTK